jgi:hypothetical protein
MAQKINNNDPRHANGQHGKIGEFLCFSAIDFPPTGAGYFLLLKDFNSLFPSCNCFTRTRGKKRFFIRNCFVAVIIQATYAKIDSFSALLFRPKTPNIIPTMAGTFNIFTLCGEAKISATFIQ